MRGEGKSLGGSGRLNLLYFTCLGGSERLSPSYFTCLERLQEVQLLKKLRGQVGPLPKNLRLEASEALRLAEARVLRVLEALGCSLYVFYVSWRLWEAHFYMFYVSGRLQGGPTFYEPKAPGGSPSSHVKT